MATNSTSLAKDIQRYHEDNVQAAHTVPVAVAFRLYEKLGSAGAGTFKPRSKTAPNATEPFWMYLFQECWDKSIQLTHEIYVNENGNTITSIAITTARPKSGPKAWTPTAQSS